MAGTGKGDGKEIQKQIKRNDDELFDEFRMNRKFGGCNNKVCTIYIHLKKRSLNIVKEIGLGKTQDTRSRDEL